MHRSYNDIRSKLGEPLWWDERCVPRYCEFSPARLGVYDVEAALYLIACQSCRREFKVAFSRSDYHWAKGEFVRHDPMTVEGIKKLHFGDPPRHDCDGGGDTMNCDDLCVLEFWSRRLGDREWTRLRSLEVALADLGEGANL